MTKELITAKRKTTRHIHPKIVCFFEFLYLAKKKIPRTKETRARRILKTIESGAVLLRKEKRGERKWLFIYVLHSI